MVGADITNLLLWLLLLVVSRKSLLTGRTQNRRRSLRQIGRGRGGEGGGGERE